MDKIKQAYKILMDEVNEYTPPRGTPITSGDITQLNTTIKISTIAICDAITLAAQHITDEVYRNK